MDKLAIISLSLSIISIILTIIQVKRICGTYKELIGGIAASCIPIGNVVIIVIIVGDWIDATRILDRQVFKD